LNVIYTDNLSNAGHLRNGRTIILTLNVSLLVSGGYDIIAILHHRKQNNT